MPSCFYSTGPSCSKHRSLNELVSGQNVNCSSKYKISNTGIVAKKSYLHFSSKNTSIYAVFNDQSLNNKLTNDIISSEQLGLNVNVCLLMWSTVNALKLRTSKFLTKWYMQTVQRQIILLLQEQSD